MSDMVPIKCCPKCYLVCYSAKRVCPECGWQFYPVKKKGGTK